MEIPLTTSIGQNSSTPGSFDPNIWAQVKTQLQIRNQDNKWVETWIEPIELIETKVEGNKTKIILGVPSSIHHYFIIENLLQQVYHEISGYCSSEFEIDVIISPRKASQNSPISLSEALHKADYSVSSESSSSDKASFNIERPQNAPHISSLNNAGQFKSQTIDGLNPDHLFSTFVVGKNTEFAHAASFNVAQNPGAHGYNPLFIFGPVGMGKTHLLHAVGNQIRSSFRDLKINYVSAEKFLNECVSSIRRSDMEKFRRKYRDDCQILLVDDVQMIGKTEAVQEEFFHTINSFIERHKQVVIASDRMPKDILGLADRNRSRLEWGLIADISMPDVETRVAILRYKAEKMSIRLSDEVATYVGRISKRSIRELEGNLKKIKMFSELQGLSIDMDLAKRVLATHESTTSISMEDIQKLVADHYKVRIADLKSTTRARQIVVPRQVAMYLIKQTLDKSLMDIGKAFGGKDHTTVMNALQRIQFLQNRELEIKNDIDELLTRIQNITGV